MPTKELTYKQYLYLLNRIAYWLQKNNKKVATKKEYTVGKNKKTLKQVTDTIKKNGTKYGKDEYIGRYVEYIITNGKDNTDLPNYVKSGDGKRKYTKKAYIDMVKRTVNFRKTNSRNPKTVKGTYTNITTTTQKSTTSSGLHDYLTSQGCSGMGQCTSFYCACNSLQQSFYRLTGIKVDEKTIAGWAGTTTSGTDHDGINTAVSQFNKKYNKKVKIAWYNFSDLGGSSSKRWSKVAEYLKKGAVFAHLLYRDKWGHYEPIKSVGDYLKILNSLGDQCGNGTYCGYIETRSRSEQESYINGISQKSIAVLVNS